MKFTKRKNTFYILNCLILVFLSLLITKEYQFASFEPTRMLQSHINKKILLLGGGPSSSPVLLHLLLLKDKVDTLFCGNPSESLIFRGRDPQKTFLGLMKVARKYKTFDNLKEQTKSFYEYIVKTSNHFNTPLIATIQFIYSFKYHNFDNKGLIKPVNSSNFIECDISEETFSINGDVLKKKDSSGLYFIDKNNIEYYTPALNRKDFNYLSIFFPNWSPSSSFSQFTENQDNLVLFNRVGFQYPDSNTKILMKSLNKDYANLSNNFYKLFSRRTELENTLFKIFNDYLNSISFEEEKLLKDNRKFIIVGCGRAAGEIARRLYHDVDFKGTEQAFKKLFQNQIEEMEGKDVKEEELEELFQSYRQSIQDKRRTVYVVDHKILEERDLEEGSLKFQSLIQSSAYSDFFLEICKHDVCPILTIEQISYYSKLVSAIKSFSSQNEELCERIQHLLDSQEETQRNEQDEVKYSVLFSTTRDKEEVKKLSLERGIDKEAVVVLVGGAKQKDISSMLHPESKTHTEVEKEGYELKRIMRSHFRIENLDIIQNIGDGKNEKSLSQLSRLFKDKL